MILRREPIMAAQKNTVPNAGSGGGDKSNPDRPDHKRSQKEIDETVEDTFPASDPPSWSPGTATPEKDK